MHHQIKLLHDNISRVFLGNPRAVDRLICCYLSRGHALIEDVPGVGKTVLANALARSIDCSFSRIQLTPDMLPSDVLGVSVYSRSADAFEFKRGPIFANIVLADEINRTPPRTQTALLEAMSDGSVSMDGIAHTLEPPFMVLATQNPYEFEGTYLLPENQLDRFLMRLRLGYPGHEDEVNVLQTRPGTQALGELRSVLSAADILGMQRAVDEVRIERPLLDHIVRFATATREHEMIRVGLSPRGSLALAQAARATAFFNGRDYAVPEDIIGNIEPVCAHRVIPDTPTLGDAANVAGLLQDVLETVASPV